MAHFDINDDVIVVIVIVCVIIVVVIVAVIVVRAVHRNIVGMSGKQHAVSGVGTAAINFDLLSD